MRKTARVRVVVGIGGASESVWASLWCGLRTAGGGVLRGSTGAVDGGVEPHGAAGGQGRMGCCESATRGWWLARVRPGVSGLPSGCQYSLRPGAWGAGTKGCEAA
ncbi:hypothetical protein K439DRAFT_1616656 [Ramaria rubella]|nr:hypothetical protein K439DRAFT_1616656 [Ramaria rubella]